MLNKHKSIIFFCVFRFLRKDVNMQKNADSASAYYAPFRRGVMSCSIRKSQSPKKVPSLEAFLLEDLILLLKPKTVLFFSIVEDIEKNSNLEPPGKQDSSWNSIDLYNGLNRQVESVYSPPVQWTWKAGWATPPAPEFHSTRQRLVWNKYVHGGMLPKR